jgi:hypothetical protein
MPDGFVAAEPGEADLPAEIEMETPGWRVPRPSAGDDGKHDAEGELQTAPSQRYTVSGRGGGGGGRQAPYSGETGYYPASGGTNDYAETSSATHTPPYGQETGDEAVLETEEWAATAPNAAAHTAARAAKRLSLPPASSSQGALNMSAPGALSGSVFGVEKGRPSLTPAARHCVSSGAAIAGCGARAELPPHCRARHCILRVRGVTNG